MIDMPSDFWSGWIITITTVSFIGLGWLIFSIYFTPVEEHEDEPVWDDNLREGSNPAPMWWFWMILTLMVISVVYIMLYPGMGSFAGVLKWSQGGRLADTMVSYESEFGGVRRLVAGAQIETIQADDSLMHSAQRVFDRNCAACHGLQAQGQANYFPNLVDDDWQWGGTPAQIEASIRQGRKAVMVGWQQVLGDDGVEAVSDYVLALGTDSAANHPGKQQYDQFCIACHMPDGSGQPALGAPSLVDDVWLYGSDKASLHESIANGRSGEMPAFAHRLDDTQINLLVAWLTNPER